MANFRGWEWVLILLLALLLFGGFKKLPDAARGIGRSLRIFKAETKGLTDDDKPAAPEPAADAATPATSDAPVAAAAPAPAAPADAPAQPKAGSSTSGESSTPVSNA